LAGTIGHNQESSAEKDYTHHDKRRRNPHWNQIFHVLLKSRIKNMIHCTAQLCRQGDVASLDDDTYEILLSDEAFRPQ
jgi:hypothetical protein